MKLPRTEFEEKPINWDTYRFAKVGRPRRDAENKVVLKLSLDRATVIRLNNLANRLDCSLADACEMLMNTEQAVAIEPIPTVTPKRDEKQRPYSLLDTITRSKKRFGLS